MVPLLKMSLSNMFIFISPHPDDVVLSCGGLITELRKLGGKCIVITIFDGGPNDNQPLHEITKQYVSEDLNISEASVDYVACWDLVRSRQKEDSNAFNLLGIDLISLNIADAIYRGYYSTEQELFSIPNPEDSKEALKQLEEEFVKWSGEQNSWFFPMALGHHVDHQIIRSLGDRLLNEGENVCYYEEFPYNQQANFESSTTYYLEEDIHTLKANAILAYKSQLQCLFGGEEIVIEGIKNGTFPSKEERYLIHIG